MNQRKLVSWMALFCVLALCIAGAIKFAMAHYNAAIQKMAKLDAEERLALRELADLSQLRAELKYLRSQDPAHGVIYWDGETRRDALLAMQQATREVLSESGITVRTTKVSVLGVDDRQLSIGVVAQSTLKALQNALLALEYHTPQIVVERLSLQNEGSSRQSDPNLNVRLQLIGVYSDNTPE